MLNQERPNPIDAKQVKREENNRDQSNDCRVLYFIRRRPRDATHFRARVTQELRGSSKEARCCN